MVSTLLALLSQGITPAQIATPWLQQGITGSVVVVLGIVVVVLYRRDTARSTVDEKTIGELRHELKTEREGRIHDKAEHASALGQERVQHQALLLQTQKAHQEALDKVQGERFSDQRSYAQAAQEMQREVLGTLRDVNQSVEGSVEFQQKLKELIDALPRRFERIEERLDDLAGKARKLSSR